MEGEFEELLQNITPTKPAFALARTMFRKAWDQQVESAEQGRKELQKQINATARKSEEILDKIVATTNELELNKAAPEEKLQNQGEPCWPFEEALEHTLKVVVSTWKKTKMVASNFAELSSNQSLQPPALPLKRGASNTKISVSAQFISGKFCWKFKYGAQERTRTSTSIRTLAPEASASTIPPPGQVSWSLRLSPCLKGVKRNLADFRWCA